MSREKEETTYKEVIGITVNDEIIMLNSIFKYEDGFCGATGSVYNPIDQDYIDRRNDPQEVASDYAFLWREAVAAQQTEDSLENYMQLMIDHEVDYGDGYYFGHDPGDSYLLEGSELQEKYFPDAVTFENTGAGRIFDAKDRYEWKVVLRPDLLEKILEVEAEAEARNLANKSKEE